MAPSNISAVATVNLYSLEPSEPTFFPSLFFSFYYFFGSGIQGSEKRAITTKPSVEFTNFTKLTKSVIFSNGSLSSKRSLEPSFCQGDEIFFMPQAVAVPRGEGTWGDLPPKSQNSAKIVEERWHRISWVYL